MVVYSRFFAKGIITKLFDYYGFMVVVDTVFRFYL